MSRETKYQDFIWESASKHIISFNGRHLRHFTMQCRQQTFCTSTWDIRANASHSSGWTRHAVSHAVTWQICQLLMAWRGIRARFLSLLHQSWNGMAGVQGGGAIYTWHLLTKCARWPVDNAHSLTFSGLYSWQTQDYLIRICWSTTAVGDSAAVALDIIVKRPFGLHRFHLDSLPLPRCLQSALLCRELECKDSTTCSYWLLTHTHKDLSGV